MQKEYNDLLASNDVLKQRLETKFKLLKYDNSLEKMFERIEQEYESNVSKISITSSTIETKNLKLVKEMGDKVKHFDEEKKMFENKISKMKKVLAQQVKDFDDPRYDDEDDDDGDSQGDDDQDDDNEHTESENDGDDFLHPKLSTFDEEERHDEKQDEEEEGVNIEEEKLDEDMTNEEEEVDELYNDVNINLEGRDTEMTDASLTNEDTHVIMTVVTPEAQQQSSFISSGFISNMLNPNPDTSIDFILNLNTKSTSLVDDPVSKNIEMPPSSVTTLPPPPIPFIQPQQQTPVPPPAIVVSTSLQNLPTFGSLFKFEDRVKALKDDFSIFKQTNLFAKTLSSIPGIVDMYLANKMNEAVKTAVQLQSDRLKDEAQAENEDFINKLDENIKKIIKEQVKVRVKEQVTKILPRIEKLVNEQLESEVLTRSSNEAKTSHVVAANLTLRWIKPGAKRSRAGKELKSTSEPKEKTSKSTGKSIEGSKSHQKSTGKSAQAEEPIHTADDLEEPAPHEFDTGFTEYQPVEETSQLPDCNLARNNNSHDSFNELMDTPLDFSGFVMNRLKVDTLTQELLADPTFELMKGSHLYWITVRRNYDKLYTFKEGDYKRLGFQDIEDMLILLTQGKLTNLTIEERLALNVSLRMFTRTIVIQRRVEDVQLGVESYQKKLNLIRPDTDGTLNDVWIALEDILKKIRMKYLPQKYWRNVDKERA
nr:hypothetical protein [Tanacetum cinerariifolium]